MPIYYYKIYPPYAADPDKKWAITQSGVLLNVFKRDPEWRPARTQRQVQYADHNSPIKNFFRARAPIPRKDYHAKLLAGLPFWPATIIFKPNGQPDFLGQEESKQLYKSNQLTPHKWYLKPIKGHGGEGIVVLRRPQDARSYIRDGRRYQRVSGNRDGYVLQKGIPNLLLMQGYKFDMRVWVLFVFKQRKFHVYMYKDAFLRVSSEKYRNQSTNLNSNLTNLSLQRAHRSRLSKTYPLSSQPYYKKVLPKIQAACSAVVQRLQETDALVKNNQKGYEIMGLDFILDKKYDPYLLELNRFIGYPYNAGNKATVRMIHQMMRDVMDLAVKPMIYSSTKPRQGGWIPLTTF